MRWSGWHGDQLPRWGALLLGVLCLLLGAFLTLHPFSSLAVLVLAVVAALVVAGVCALRAPQRPALPRLLRGGVLVLAALAVLVWPGATIRVVATAVGVALLVDGAFDLLEARRAAGRERWNALLGGVSGVVFGLLALLWPDVSVIVIAVLFGTRLVILGFRLLSGAVRRGAADARDVRAPDDSARTGRRGVRRLAGNVVGVLVALALAAAGVALARSAPSPDDFYEAPSSLPSQPGTLLRSEPFHTYEIPAQARAWRILYTTTRDEGGAPAVASGLVIVPASASTPVPVVAWAHGTTGFARGCAPSVLQDGLAAGAFHLQDAVVARGWAVVASDYIGLGTTGPHPYLIGQGEGRSVLDSIRAAHQLPGARLAADTVVWGHSQGGHAALWTGILAKAYAPELTIDGIAALAPASNLPGLIGTVDHVTGGEVFASFVAAAYSQTYPDVRFGDLVRPGARVIVREMAERCLSEKSSLVSLLTALTFDKPIWAERPDRGVLHERLVANIPTGSIDAPVLVAQGLADTLVVPGAQEDYVGGRCEAGYAVEYRPYEGLGHVQLIERDSPLVPDLVAWTTDRLAGKPASNTC